MQPTYSILLLSCFLCISNYPTVNAGGAGGRVRPGAMEVCIWSWATLFLTVTTAVFPIELLHIEDRRPGNQVDWTHQEPYFARQFTIWSLHTHTYMYTIYYRFWLVIHMPPQHPAIPLLVSKLISSIIGCKNVLIVGLAFENHKPPSKRFLVLNL